jgi:hypothetical protein
MARPAGNDWRKNDTKMYDENGWFVFCKEKCLIFYPAYGDSINL